MSKVYGVIVILIAFYTLLFGIAIPYFGLEQMMLYASSINAYCIQLPWMVLFLYLLIVEKDKDAFLSISDCYNTIRLHPNLKNFSNKELRAYKIKLKKLEDFISDYRHNLPDISSEDKKYNYE